MKRFVCAMAAILMLTAVFPARVWAVDLPIRSEAAILIEKETGQVLYAKNEHKQLEPASVTKVMTLLLTMEAIDSGALRYDDMVTASDYASSMGGSQIFLAPGEQMSVEDLLKGVCVASGNDASVALAEHLAGVTELFVSRMNNRAKELGMNDTNFVNCNGLPAEGHVTSAYDIALMSRELILHHPDIRRFTTIWMDTLRGGASELSNTNKLIRFYDGATGLKTGSTSSAGYCISATAERDGMELIAVTLKADTSSDRFEDQNAAELRLFHLRTGGRRGRGDTGRRSRGAGHGRHGATGAVGGGAKPAAGTVPGVGAGPDGDLDRRSGGPGGKGAAAGTGDRHIRRYGTCHGAHSGGGGRAAPHLGSDLSAAAALRPAGQVRGLGRISPLFCPCIFHAADLS